MTLKPKHFSAALRRRRALAAEIGLLMADYAALEWSLFHLFAILSRLRPEEVFSAFFSKRSINKKTELLEAESWRLSQPLQRAMKRLIRRMKGAASRRTEIAHAHMMTGGDAVLRLHLFGDRATLTPLDGEFVDRTISQFHTLAVDLGEFTVILLALAPEILVARIEAVHAPIDLVLKRTPGQSSHRVRFSKADERASRRRLGLEELTNLKLYLSVEKDMAWTYRS